MLQISIEVEPYFRIKEEWNIRDKAPTETKHNTMSRNETPKMKIPNAAKLRKNQEAPGWWKYHGAGLQNAVAVAKQLQDAK